MVWKESVLTEFSCLIRCSVMATAAHTQVETAKTRKYDGEKSKQRNHDGEITKVR